MIDLLAPVTNAMTIDYSPQSSVCCNATLYAAAQPPAAVGPALAGAEA